MTTPITPPNPVKVATNPVGAGVDLVTGITGVAIGVPDFTGGLADRLSSFASDRLLDIGATLMLMLLGVAIATAGVLRIFAATAATETGGTVVKLGTTAAGIKSGKF